MSTGILDSNVELKIELQSLGAVAPPGIFSRAGGAGPSDGVTIFLEEVTATVPVKAWYAKKSPFSIRGLGEDGWELARNGETLRRIEIAGEPAFYLRKTSGGVPYQRIALRHGKDAIGSTVIQGCVHREDACRFCGIKLSIDSGDTIASKSPEELAEVAAAAADEGFRHVVLTTGATGSPDGGIGQLARCAEAIKRKTKLKVHVQFDPPLDLDQIDFAGEAADSASVNIECFDGYLLKLVAPAKSAYGLNRYVEAWARAVRAFGPGQVASFLMVGLGESCYSILEGSRLLASLGVYPFLLPLRPLAGTPIEGWAPPPPAETMRVFEKSASIVRKSGLKASDFLAGCPRCGACSAFPDITG